MDFDRYVSEHLPRVQTDRFLEGSRENEVRYMRAHGWRFRRLLKCLPDDYRPRRVLEIGPTPFTLYLKQLHPEWEMWALDLTDHFGTRFAADGVQLRCCDLDRAEIPFADSTFDLLLCTEVLEHVFAPPTSVVAELARVLRPGGRLLLSVPNLATLGNRVQFLFGCSPLPNPDEQMNTGRLHGHAHVREYTRREIVRVCRAAGLRVLKTRMIWKNPADIARLMRTQPEALFRQVIYVGKLLHALFNAALPWFRGCILVECRKP
jgi:SAM-dependent methyltransferase